MKENLKDGSCLFLNGHKLKVLDRKLLVFLN